MSCSDSPDALVEAALAMIPHGAVVGLGSGRAATRFVRALGRRVADGLQISGVPTSQGTADLARKLGIPLATLDDVESIDIDIDGADEVDPQLNLIKGLGGALVREKLVAAASRRVVILAGPEKMVSQLGEHGVLPVEIVPFALSFCRRQLEQRGYRSVQRKANGQIFTTDNGNYILDCKIRPITDPAALEQSLLSIPGVVGTGLFLDIADTVLIDRGNKVEVHERRQRER
ncbi:MAG TPA: ribose-5-phosphate isomerase RpiA [Pirellulales bacterium]|jgi:ribose 5-phosphate isomerase A|nr:ribose-5-phosphate isomerase RpiA [Pirellulales bacterium]